MIASVRVATRIDVSGAMWRHARDVRPVRIEVVILVVRERALENRLQGRAGTHTDTLGPPNHRGGAFR